jgi:hypothetical protein
MADIYRTADGGIGHMLGLFPMDANLAKYEFSIIEHALKFKYPILKASDVCKFVSAINIFHDSLRIDD